MVRENTWITVVDEWAWWSFSCRFSQSNKEWSHWTRTCQYRKYIWIDDPRHEESFMERSAERCTECDGEFRSTRSCGAEALLSKWLTTATDNPNDDSVQCFHCNIFWLTRRSLLCYWRLLYTPGRELTHGENGSTSSGWCRQLFGSDGSWESYHKWMSKPSDYMLVGMSRPEISSCYCESHEQKCPEYAGHWDESAPHTQDGMRTYESLTWRRRGRSIEDLSVGLCLGRFFVSTLSCRFWL